MINQLFRRLASLTTCPRCDTLLEVEDMDRVSLASFFCPACGFRKYAHFGNDWA